MYKGVKKLYYPRRTKLGFRMRVNIFMQTKLDINVMKNSSLTNQTQSKVSLPSLAGVGSRHA
jgi:hypothetical protein